MQHVFLLTVVVSGSSSPFIVALVARKPKNQSLTHWNLLIKRCLIKTKRFTFLLKNILSLILFFQNEEIKTSFVFWMNRFLMILLGLCYFFFGLRILLMEANDASSGLSGFDGIRHKTRTYEQ